MNEVKVGAQYLHRASGTFAKVTGTCELKRGEETIPGVLFTLTDVKNETPRVLSLEDFNACMTLVKLYDGCKVLMVSMGRVIGETTARVSEQEGLFRLEHGGELVNQNVYENGTLQVVYTPKESQAFIFTVNELDSVVAKRDKVRNEMIAELRAFEEALNNWGVLNPTNKPLCEVRDALKRRLQRCAEELGFSYGTETEKEHEGK